jgi:predicted secreted protein
MTSPLLQLTEQQNDQALDVAQGGTIIVSLGSNHDTGHAWTLAAPVPSELKQDGEPRYDAPPRGAVKCSRSSRRRRGARSCG